VKIYLLLIDNERFFFYSDENEASHESSEPTDSTGPRQSRLHGWLQGQLAKFRSAWHQAESGLTLWLRRVWEWLHSWSHPDEWMLARLRSARKIELRHPESRSGDEVLAIWQDYLAQQRKRHLTWLCINSVIAPWTLLLVPLPGPNVVGIWFLYRVIHHLLVVWGIRMVRRGVIPTELHPLPALDVPIDRDADGKACHRALESPAALLQEHVTYSEMTHSRRAAKRMGQSAKLKKNRIEGPGNT
jgi:hypothetical protein